MAAKPYVYGQPLNNWKEASDALKGIHEANKPKGPSLSERLESIEQLLKEKK